MTGDASNFYFGVPLNTNKKFARNFKLEKMSLINSLDYTQRFFLQFQIFSSRDYNKITFQLITSISKIFATIT